MTYAIFTRETPRVMHAARDGATSTMCGHPIGCGSGLVRDGDYHGNTPYRTCWDYPRETLEETPRRAAGPTGTVRCDAGCGQLAHSPDGRPAICPACTRELEAERARPQGEAVRLFEPAPAVMPGQTTML